MTSIKDRFPVGTRVVDRRTGQEIGSVVGYEGNNLIGVAHDKPAPHLNNCYGLTPPNCGWWYFPENIQVFTLREQIKRIWEPLL